MISMTTWIALMMEREGKWWWGQWEGKWHHDDDEEDSDNNKNLHKIIEIKKKITKPAVREGADCPKMEFFIRNRFGSMSAPTPTNIIDQNSVSQP